MPAISGALNKNLNLCCLFIGPGFARHVISEWNPCHWTEARLSSRWGVARRPQTQARRPRSWRGLHEQWGSPAAGGSSRCLAALVHGGSFAVLEWRSRLLPPTSVAWDPFLYPGFTLASSLRAKPQQNLKVWLNCRRGWLISDSYPRIEDHSWEIL